jgi:phosphonopyruvate decarboxylase
VRPQLEPCPPPSATLDPDDALRTVQAAVSDGDAVLATTGYTGRALYALSDRPNQFYMVGSMGCVSSLGLGLAKVQPHRRIVVIDGDGAMLMRLGAVAAIGHERPSNLVHVLLDNGVHDSTGSQATLSPSVDLPTIARACGYPHIVGASTVEDLRVALRAATSGPSLIHVRTTPRSDRRLPRPTLTPEQVAERFRGWLSAGRGQTEA